jgi:low temperature requirement protein LtrA
VVIGALAGGSAQYWWWALAIALDLVAAGVGGQLEGWNLHADHFVERHGLIVIIALGETLIVAAAGLSDAALTPLAIVTGALAVAVTSGMWWSYFSHARRAFEHALGGRDGHARSSMARDVFSVMHFPMLCGVIAMAAGTEVALAHPEARLDTGVRVALSAGALLFVGGTAAAIWRATGRVLAWRLVIVPAFAAAVVVAGGRPWLALTTLLAMLVALALVEASQV